MAAGIEAHVSLIMDSDGLTTAAYTGTDKAMENFNLCSNSTALHEESGGKEMDVLEGNIKKEETQCVDRGELLKLDELGTAGDILDLNASLVVNTDNTDKDAAGFDQEACKTFISDAECVTQDVSDATFVSYHLLHQATKSPESSREEDTDRALSDLTHGGESWEQMTSDSNPEEDYIQISRRRNYSDLSTLRAESTDASNRSLADSDYFILDAEEVGADGRHRLSCDSLSSIEFMETNDIGMDDFRLVPMDSLQVSLVSNNSQAPNEIGAGPTAFHSLNFSITGADWHMASLPVKCLEMGAVNVASLTLGTVGISVIPMVSPGTIDINPFTDGIGLVPIEPTDWETWSMDSMPLATMSAEYVSVDSITPEGVRERWHPLEDRLCALGEALTTLDKKLEGFSPRIQEAETLLNEVELSVSQHAMHVSDIVRENNALVERLLLLEERLSQEKQQQPPIWVKRREEEA